MLVKDFNIVIIGLLALKVNDGGKTHSHSFKGCTFQAHIAVVTEVGVQRSGNITKAKNMMSLKYFHILGSTK